MLVEVVARAVGLLDARMDAAHFELRQLTSESTQRRAGVVDDSTSCADKTVERVGDTTARPAGRDVLPGFGIANTATLSDRRERVTYTLIEGSSSEIAKRQAGRGNPMVDERSRSIDGAISRGLRLQRQPCFTIALEMLKMIGNAVRVKTAELEQRVGPDRKIQAPDVIGVDIQAILAQVQQAEIPTRSPPVGCCRPEALEPGRRRGGISGQVSAPHQLH